MEKTMQIQMQIRQNADEISTALTDIKSWEKKMKTKETKTSNKRSIPRRNGGGTVPLRTFTTNSATTTASSNTILTPASIVDNTLAKTHANNNNSIKNDGNVHNNNGNVPKAIGTYQEKDLEENERERGNLEFKNGNFSNAVKSYTRCLGLKKNNYVAFSNRAMAYLKMKEYTRAVLDCTSALSIEPGHVKSLMRRATAYNAMGKHRAAVKDLLKAMEYEPTNKQLKLDLLQSKEMLKNAVNRAPMIPVLSFDEFLANEEKRNNATTKNNNNNDDDDAIEEQKEPVKEELAAILQGPDLPTSQYQAQLEKIRESQAMQQLTEVINNERPYSDEYCEDAEVAPTEKEPDEPTTTMTIDILSDDEEEEENEEKKEESSPTIATLATPVEQPPQKVTKKKASNIETKKKETKKKSVAGSSSSSSSAASVVPKSIYSLEQYLLQYSPAVNNNLSSTSTFSIQEKNRMISILFLQMKRKEIIQLFKSCFEPQTLSLFLFTANSYYLSQLQENGQDHKDIIKTVYQLYDEISQLSNFSMLFSLLLQEEKEKIRSGINDILANTHEENTNRPKWEVLLQKYSI